MPKREALVDRACKDAKGKGHTGLRRRVYMAGWLAGYARPNALQVGASPSWSAGWRDGQTARQTDVVTGRASAKAEGRQP